jgi:hypothetical protein
MLNELLFIKILRFMINLLANKHFIRTPILNKIKNLLYLKLL